jgi:hypothetical protein
LFCIIALDIHDHTIGKFKAVTVVSGNKCFFLEYAAFHHRLDFRVFSLYRRLTLVQQGNLPIASATGALTAYDEFVGFTGLFVGGISDDGCCAVRLRAAGRVNTEGD